MIASHSLNFVFIKTTKTAGTSTEIILSSWCSGKDICTTITPIDEITRAKFGGKPLNFSSRPDLESKLNNAINEGDLSGINDIRKCLRPHRNYYNHMPAKEIRSKLPELWKSAFKFCIERHPYEKVVSRAYWELHKLKGPSSIVQKLDDVIDSGLYIDEELYSIDGEIAVDAILRYETLEVDLAKLAKRFNQSIPGELPTAKMGIRKDRRPATDILSAKQKEKIQERAFRQFEYLGYEM